MGKQPLDLTPEQWENHRERRFLNPDPDLDAHHDRMLDRQLDPRLTNDESATIAGLRSVAHQAIARLETLAAGHSERAEANAARRSAILSFDASTEGERLRRYAFSCSRSLFRSLDTLLKIRRSGLASADGERIDETERDLPFPVEAETIDPIQSGQPPDSIDDLETVGCSETIGEEPAIERLTMEAEETQETNTEQPVLCQDPCSEAVLVDRVTVQDEPRTPAVDSVTVQNEPIAPHLEFVNPQSEHDGFGVAVIVERSLPFFRVLVTAMILVFVYARAVRGQRSSQNEARSEHARPAVLHAGVSNEPRGDTGAPGLQWRRSACGCRVPP